MKGGGLRDDLRDDCRQQTQRFNNGATHCVVNAGEKSVVNKHSVVSRVPIPHQRDAPTGGNYLVILFFPSTWGLLSFWYGNSTILFEVQLKP